MTILVICDSLTRYTLKLKRNICNNFSNFVSGTKMLWTTSHSDFYAIFYLCTRQCMFLSVHNFISNCPEVVYLPILDGYCGEHTIWEKHSGHKLADWKWFSTISFCSKVYMGEIMWYNFSPVLDVKVVFMYQGLHRHYLAAEMAVTFLNWSLCCESFPTFQICNLI